MKTIIAEIITLFGFLLSFYDWHIEKKLKENDSYKPLCDISDKISCTKAIKSKYSNIFFLQNNILGMLFYTILFFSIFTGPNLLIQILTTTGFIFSITMAYILFFRIKTTCLICIFLYLINTFLFLLFDPFNILKTFKL